MPQNEDEDEAGEGEGDAHHRELFGAEEGQIVRARGAGGEQEEEAGAGGGEGLAEALDEGADLFATGGGQAGEHEVHVVELDRDHESLESEEADGSGQVVAVQQERDEDYGVGDGLKQGDVADAETGDELVEKEEADGEVDDIHHGGEAAEEGSEGRFVEALGEDAHVLVFADGGGQEREKQQRREHDRVAGADHLADGGGSLRQGGRAGVGGIVGFEFVGAAADRNEHGHGEHGADGPSEKQGADAEARADGVDEGAADDRTEGAAGGAEGEEALGVDEVEVAVQEIPEQGVEADIPEGGVEFGGVAERDRFGALKVGAQQPERDAASHEHAEGGVEHPVDSPA